MTVALVLAGTGEADQGLGLGEHTAAPSRASSAFNEELAALGVSRIDAADRDGHGMLTVAAAARAAGDWVLICAGVTPTAELARLIRTEGTAAVASYGSTGALLVNPGDLGELAEAAEELAANNHTPDPVGALLGELARRGVSVRVVDGATESQLVTDPVAADIARWAGERELTPMALYGISLSLGLISAMWFSELALRAKGFAIIALFAAFVTARAGHMLDVTNRTTGGYRSPAASWLRLAGAIITEFGLYAGIAVSAAVTPGAGDGLSGIFGAALKPTFVDTLGGQGVTGVWHLAITAMVFLAVRQMADRCVSAAGIRPDPSRFTRLVCLPVGERLTLLCASVVFVGSRFAFLVLLAWGAVAFGYALTGLFATRDGDTLPADVGREIAACRGDGPFSIWLGRFAVGRIPPLVPLSVGLLVTCMLTALGLGNLPGILVLAPVVAMLLAALGSSSPHDGTRDWLVPAILQAAEYLYITALAFTHSVSAPVTFALLGAVVLRHFEIACRARIWPPDRSLADETDLGWEGRMVLAGLAAFFGVVPLVYAIMAGWMWLMLLRDFVTRWVPAGYRCRLPGC